ncbi:MAG: hypothetical protein NVS9B7_09370 [Flavisolibacter sp.]
MLDINPGQDYFIWHLNTHDFICLKKNFKNMPVDHFYSFSIVKKKLFKVMAPVNSMKPIQSKVAFLRYRLL